MSKSSGDVIEGLRQKLSKDVLHSAVNQLLGIKTQKKRPETEMKIAEIIYLYKDMASDSILMSQVRDELQGIEKATGKLIKCIELSVPLTMSRFRATDLRDWFLQEKDTSDLLDDHMLADGKKAKLVTLLRDVMHVAKQARDPEVWPIGLGDEARYSGPPFAKRELVRCCLQLFKAHRPGEATSTENGDFLLFVGFVWELATGESDVNLKTVASDILKLA